MLRRRHGHVVEGQPGGGRAADAALGHPRLDDLEARHVGRDQKRRDLRVAAARIGRAGHHGQDVGDRAVGDVALAAVQDIGLAVVGEGVAVVCTLLASEPACSSVRAKAASFSPLASGGSQRAFCSGVPNRTRARRPIE